MGGGVDQVDYVDDVDMDGVDKGLCLFLGGLLLNKDLERIIFFI